MFLVYSILRTTLSTERRVLTAQIAGAGAMGADDTEVERVDGVEVFQPLGLAARPYLTTQTEALGVESGDEVHALWMGDKSASVWSASDLPEGATVLYGAKNANARVTLSPDGDATIRCESSRTITVQHPSGAVIRITSAGAVEIQAAAGQNVAVNGGSKNVAREEDSLNVGTLVATAGPYPVLFTYVAGVAGNPLPAPPGGVSLRGVITTGTGATRFKG